MPRERFEPMEVSRWDELVKNDQETKLARRAVGMEIVLGLDTTVSFDQYVGLASPELVAALRFIRLPAEMLAWTNLGQELALAGG